MHRESTEVRHIDNIVTSRNAKTGERYIAVFNTSEENKDFDIDLINKGLIQSSKVKAINLWTKKEVKIENGRLKASPKKHESILLKIKEI